MTHNHPDRSGLDPESLAALPTRPRGPSTADFKSRFGGGDGPGLSGGVAGVHEAVTMPMAPVTPAALATPGSVAPEKKKGNPVVGFLVLAVLVAVPIIAFTSCGSDNHASHSAEATMPAAKAAPSMSAVPDPLDRDATPSPGLSCADVGGVFEKHGTDGRGSCISADPRPECHVRTDAQPPNYLAEVTLSPPFPNGTVSYPFLIGMASNANCWKVPAN
ncbi:hypothetical protein [Nocardia niigatensis]|uniref:hypothetical protein n=1 Tax=Nocardia niigatensis TaxID=209249 RepID=UPI0012F625BE|nr:hypothetical protein [Nocardia niigatensis]